MSDILVIDTSVFVGFFQANEPDHPSCVQFLERIRRFEAIRIFCPASLLAEAAGAVARLSGSPEKGEDIALMIEDFPGLSFVDVDLAVGRAAAKLASTCGLRGADAVYVAVAQRLRGVLITLDKELPARCAAVVAARTPMQWIAGTRLPS